MNRFLLFFRVIRVITVGIVFIALALPVGGVVYVAMTLAAEVRRYPAPGRLIDVGTHRLLLHRMGEGGPTVILQAGAGGTVLDWSAVRPLLAKTTTVYAYDRAGLAWSEELDAKAVV